MAYPQVSASVSGASSTAATSHSVSYPSGSGGICIAIVSSPQSVSISGWDLIEAGTNGNAGLHMLGIVGGSGTFDIDLGANGHASWVVYRITGAAGIPEGEGDIDTILTYGTGTEPDPGSVTANNGTDDNLWISCCGFEGSATHTAYSTGYSDNQLTARDASGTGVASSTTELNIATENPDEHSISDDVDWVAITCVVRSPLATAHEKDLADEIELTDAFNPLDCSDPFELGDSCTRNTAFVKAVSDSLSLGDTCTRATTFVKSIGDPFSIGEALELELTGFYFRQLSDGLTIADTVATVAAFSKSLSDSISLGESVGRVTGFVKSVSDALTLAEARAMQFSRSASDSIALGESVATVASFVKSLSDSLSLGESVTRNSSFVKSVSDALTVADSCSQLLTIAKAVSDALSLGDSSTQAVTFGKSVSDALSLGESVSQVSAFAKSLTDSITIGESVTRVAAFAKSLADTLTVGESVQGSGQLLKSLSDAIAIGETVTLATAFVKSVSDSLSLSESVTRTSSFVKSVSDALVLGETVSTGSGLSKSISDAVTLGESVVTGAVFTKSLSEALTVSSAVTAAEPCPCTTGTVDIFTDASLVTVDDPTGFSVGDRIIFSNAQNIDEDLIVTIAAIDGNEITLNGSAGVSVTDDFCKICTPSGWFGPQGDCSCGCAGCTCEDERDADAKTTLSISGGAAAQTFDHVSVLQGICSGSSPASVTWAFAGISDDDLTLDDSSCEFEIESQVEPQTTPEYFGETAMWGGYADSANGCVPREALRSTIREYAGSPPFPVTLVRETVTPIILRGRLVYRCSGGSVRLLSVYGTYWIYDFLQAPAVNANMDAAWSGGYNSSTRSWAYTATVGSDTYHYTVTAIFSNRGVIAFRIELLGETAGTSIALEDAPPYYDPHSLLVGTASIS